MQEVRLPGCGIIMLHPFEGGVFSFRLIMRTLAEDVGCPALSFDRPGAGLVKLFLTPVAKPNVLQLRAAGCRALVVLNHA